MELAIVNQSRAFPYQTEPPMDLVIVNQPKVFPSQMGYQIAKRVMDVAICLLVLPLALPLMIVCALAIYLESSGPVFFVQERIGKGGRNFRIYKFRTMRTNLDDSHHRTFMKAFVSGQIGNDESPRGRRHAFMQAFVSRESNSPSDPGALSKQGNLALDLAQECHLNGQKGHKDNPKIYKPVLDPEITRVGRLLRKISLDELPQIINVLKGEMSWVGPRPNVPWEVEEYRLWHHERLEVLPGITGLAQVRGRSSINFDSIVNYDIQYIENRSVLTDIKILWWTLTTVLHAKGAD
jgi:lipopolysaccharide/colanic/teichoic acid biosynthesis glycosyltransferase